MASNTENCFSEETASISNLSSPLTPIKGVPSTKTPKSSKKFGLNAKLFSSDLYRVPVTKSKAELYGTQSVPVEVQHKSSKQRNLERLNLSKKNFPSLSETTLRTKQKVMSKSLPDVSSSGNTSVVKTNSKENNKINMKMATNNIESKTLETVTSISNESSIPSQDESTRKSVANKKFICPLCQTELLSNKEFRSHVESCVVSDEDGATSSEPEKPKFGEDKHPETIKLKNLLNKIDAAYYNKEINSLAELADYLLRDKDMSQLIEEKNSTPPKSTILPLPQSGTVPKKTVTPQVKAPPKPILRKSKTSLDLKTSFESKLKPGVSFPSLDNLIQIENQKKNPREFSGIGTADVSTEAVTVPFAERVMQDLIPSKQTFVRRKSVPKVVKEKLPHPCPAGIPFDLWVKECQKHENVEPFPLEEVTMTVISKRVKARYYVLKERYTKAKVDPPPSFVIWSRVLDMIKKQKPDERIKAMNVWLKAVNIDG